MDNNLVYPNSQSGELFFTVDSSLLFQLGEQLVAKPSIALAELVKNAYDADATKVTITLENVEQEGGTIIIEDDGHGMIFEELEENWMRIATNTKRENPESRIYHRPLTGAKGIGRFAARRLGNKLTVQSIAERIDGTKECVVAEFNWRESFHPGDDLTHVPITYTRQRVNLGTRTGVSLFIEDARDAWTEDDISDLRRDLLTIQSPFPDLVVKPKPTEIHSRVDPGFNINFEIKGEDNLEDLSGGLGEVLLEAAWAKLDGYIDNSGKAHYEIAIRVNNEKDKLTDETNNYKGLENAKLRVYYMVYRKEYFQEFDFGVRDMQKRGRAEGGVRIYLDGFRVFPYGEEENDWLRLDEFAARNTDLATDIAPPESVVRLAASVPGRPYLLIPRNYQLFGVVSISQEMHSDVEINISRERLIASPTERQLQKFVLNGIYWMTMKYGAFLAEEKEKRKKEKPSQTIPEIIEETKQKISTLPVPQETRDQITLELDYIADRTQEQEEERISEISMLRTLASAGTTISMMNHQLRALITAILRTREDLRTLQSSIPQDMRSKYDEILEQITRWHEMIKLQVSQLGFLLSPDSRERRRHHPLYQIVEDVYKPMSYYIDTHHIGFKNNVPRTLRTPSIYRAELYSILVNLLSNALKAVHGQAERRITVEAERIGQSLFIRMMDTGQGLPPEWREDSSIAFKAFETRSVPNPVLGIGTGLGLKVVMDILETYAGAARFIDVEKPWSTCIEIELPERG